MKRIKSIILSSLTFMLSVGGIAIANNKKDIKCAKAAMQTEYNAVFFHNTNINGGVPFAYVDSDNPPSNTNTLNLEDMYSLTNEFTVSGGYTTGGTTKLTITEPAPTKKFTAIYIPIIVYAQSLSYGYSFGNPTITFTIEHSGWDDDNFSNATMFYHGNGTRSGESSEYYTFFKAPNYNYAALGNSIWYVGDPSQTTFSQTHSISQATYQNINADGNPHNTIVGFYSLFLYARKDSSSSHQLSFSLSAKINFAQDVSYEVAASTSTNGYNSLHDALVNTTGGTIKIWKDITEETTLYVGSTIHPLDVILDLNGKTLTCKYMLSVQKGSSLLIKNGNIVFIGFDYSSGFIDNKGTLTIESTVNISIKTPYANNILLTTALDSVTTINGATLSPGNVNRGIYNGGTMYLNAVNIVAPSYELFNDIDNEGELYLGGKCVIKNITQSKNGIIYGKSNSIAYSGNKINLKLDSTVTAGITVASQISSSKLACTFTLNSNRYIAAYSSKDSSYITDYKYYDLTFNITGCTVGDTIYSYRYGQNLEITISPLTYYELPNSLTVISNGALLNNGVQYLYQKATGKFLIYGTFDCFGAITISGSGIDVSPKAKLTTWAQDYLHLTSIANDGYCKDETHHWYKTAKMNLLALGEDVVSELANSTDTTVASYRARYEAWASANNDLDYAYVDDYTHIHASNVSSLSSSNIQITAVIVISCIASMLVLVLVIKKKKNTIQK